MEEPDEKQPGQPESRADSAPTAPSPPITVTLGGTDAGPAIGPNPVIGTPHRPQPPVPPSVIHAAGDAHPGEANPAAPDVNAEGVPAVDTARLLADREAAETTRQEQGRLVVHSGSETLTTLGLNTSGMGELAARELIKEQQAGEVIERTGNQSGLAAVHGTYEHLEYGEAQTNVPPAEMPAGGAMRPSPPPGAARSVHATFPNRAAASRAVARLQDIGIAAADIGAPPATAADSGAAQAAADNAPVELTVRTDQLTHDAVVRVLRASGATGVR